MLIRAFLCCLFIFAAPVFGQTASRTVKPGVAGRRIALVIGNQSYQKDPLSTPRADAEAMAAMLKQDLEFTNIQIVEDGNLLAMQQAVRAFVRELREGDLALFYYSGRSIRVAGMNWLLPTDLHAQFEDEIPDQAYSAQRILNEMGDSGAKIRVLILDACRKSPLPSSAVKSFGAEGGLGRMKGSEGTYMLFSAGENQTPVDRVRDGKSLFTSYLLESLKRSGITLDTVFKETRRLVTSATSGRQRPWMETDSDQDVVLRGTLQHPTPVAGLGPDLVAWNRIKSSQNPRDFEEFLTQFPKSEMATAAKLRLDQLNRDAQTLTPANIPPSATIQALPSPPGQSSADAEALFEEGKQLQARRNYDAAWRLFLQAANMGHVKAMTQVGVALQHGQGVQQNYLAAMAWYQKAADQGDAEAVGEIGFLHHNGLGVPMNFDLARQFYLKAASLGDPSSMNNLGFLYFNGAGVTKDYGIAKDWFEKAAKLGVGASCAYLGLIYENGLGVNRSATQAADWYRKGATLGNNNSKQRLAAMGLK
jgi:uncharacterized protein